MAAALVYGLAFAFCGPYTGSSSHHAGLVAPKMSGDVPMPSQLRLFSPVECTALLSDWLTRSRVYGMSDDPTTRWRSHAVERAVESFISWGVQDASEHASEPTSLEGSPKRILLGLCCRPVCTAEHTTALAATEASWTRGLVVRHLAVNPHEANKGPSSPAFDQMMHGLELLSDSLGLNLEVKPPKLDAVKTMSTSGIVYYDSDDDSWGV